MDTNEANAALATLGLAAPQSLPDVIDTYRDVRELRLAKDKEAAALKELESFAKKALIEGIPSIGEGLSSKRFNAEITKKPTARVTDFNAVFGYAAANDRPDLIQKRINEKNVRELLDEGVEVPGTERYTVTDVSVTKRK